MCAGGQWPGVDVSRCGRDLHSDHSDVCVQVVSGQVHMSLGVDEIYTLTTVTTGQKGDHGEPPAAAPFDIEYFGYFQRET